MTSDSRRAIEMQRDLTRIALAGIDRSGFALAGSGAIREHGITQRLTEDVDLFTTMNHREQFGAAVTTVTSDLEREGYQVEAGRRAEQFARLHVTTSDGLRTDIDMGIDWRAEAPVRLSVGPVLSLPDAVGNKVSALYSRAEARDYLDVDAIRASGHYTDRQLLEGAAERDPGFDSAMFARQLDAVRRIRPVDVGRYGVTADQLAGVQTRSAQWAADIRREAELAPSTVDRTRASFPGRTDHVGPDRGIAARRSPSSAMTRDSGPER